MTDDRPEDFHDDAPTLADPRTLAAAPLPERIGAYRILGKLGEGGMGLVLEAEQKSPNRRVALKVIRGGEFADELQVRLFQREAETLARLRHPNIAAIYESGRTPGGQHFFAMELVRGDDLDQWMKRPGKGLGSRARLELFCTLADAVHHAHQRGVIHRDLKPANVKVAAAEEGSRDGRPQVKVLDFGLARLVEEDPNATMLSAAGVVRGTLGYMSPEQARGATDEIDVRTDVYSLGVMLYELLTDRRPVNTTDVSLVEAARRICESPPEPMSRSGTPRIDPDLETIARKALAKEPDARYASAAALSDDVGRWLAGEPILARPPSTMYQLRKLVARHRLPVAAAVGGLALIVVFGIGMSVLYARSERNLERALDAEIIAQAEADKARETTAFLVDIFQVADPEESRGNDLTAREILDEGAKRVETELQDTPDVQAELMDTIGVVYRQLGLFPASEELHRRSVEVRRQHFGTDSPQAAMSLTNHSTALAALSRFEEAEAEAREAVRVLEIIPEEERPRYYGIALGQLGNVLNDVGKHDEALEVLQRAVQVVVRSDGEQSVSVANLYNNLGTLVTVRDPEKGREYIEKSLAIWSNLFPEGHPRMANGYTNLATIAFDLRDYDRAVELHKKALDIHEKTLGADHPLVAEDLENLAIAYSGTRGQEFARPLFERSLEIFLGHYGPDHANVGKSRYNLGYNLLTLGHFEEAKEQLQRALDIRRKIFGEDHPTVALSLYYLGEIAQEQGRHAEARDYFRRVVAIDEKFFGPESGDVAEDLNSLAGALEALGDTEEAAIHRARAEAILAKLE